MGTHRFYFIQIAHAMSLIKSIAILAITLPKSNGWNDAIEWASDMDEFHAKVKETGKPGMVVIHKSWCGACKALKPKFAESKDIEEASKGFVMYNALDDDEPSGAEYRSARKYFNFG